MATTTTTTTRMPVPAVIFLPSAYDALFTYRMRVASLAMLFKSDKGVEVISTETKFVPQ